MTESMILIVAMAGGEGALSPALHVGVSAVLFIVVWQFLSRVFFKPYLNLLIERESRTVGDEHAAKDAIENKRKLDARIQDELAVARTQALKRREARVATAKLTAQRMIDVASEEAERELNQAKSRAAAVRAQAMSEMLPEVDLLSESLVRKVLTH